ncbi:MucBP domain-containing protein [Streptococcus vestibularis]|uniref:Extracellular matrix-binding protein ebh n=1 Tax=Streptococcus vestibularis TaxID=1343 RepID=A0A564T3T4_STRVE|nr:MucBP domain-containing protein [Streptococcus vestibularis]VUX01933.1 Extracellular matrix-binding protein ebh precursor [Streptococcus vestibularis]
MFINKKEKFSIRKFKDGRSDSVKIGTVALIVGAALAMAGQSQTASAEVRDNGDGTSTISNTKGSVNVETANLAIYDISSSDEVNKPESQLSPSKPRETDPSDTGTNTITKTGKVDYKYVTAEGNTVLEENKNQDSGADKTIETPYDVYGKSGEVFKGTTGGDAESSDLDNAKETGKKETIEKDGKTYHLIGEPKVETTGDGAGVYSDTTLGDVTAKLTPEGLSNAEGKITYDTVKAGGKAWIVEQTGKGTYGKYVQADSGAITSDAKMVEAFKAGEAAAKDFTSANVTTDGGIKEGDYVFVLEKNTYTTVKNIDTSLTAGVRLTANRVDGLGPDYTINDIYAMVEKSKNNPDSLVGEKNKEFVKGYVAYLTKKGLEDNLATLKRFMAIGHSADADAKVIDSDDSLDEKGRPTLETHRKTDDLELSSGTDQIYPDNVATDEATEDFDARFDNFTLTAETYSYRDEITPLRAYRLASGTTTITYTYAEEKTREIEKKGSVVVNYQTEDGTELKAPYTDTPETVAEVVTEKYYVDANGQDVIVSSTTASKNVAYNTKENETEKPEKLTDTAGNVYYLKADATKTAVNDVEKDAPAEEGTVVEGVTKVTYIYEKAGSVIVNYKTVDGTPLTGTVVDEDGAGKTIESGAKDTDNGKPGTAYNTADNGMKPTRIKTAEGKVYELVPESTEGEETGEVVAGETKEVTYVYKEVKGNVVVKYEDTEGNTLAADEQDETDASLNVKYDTADHKKDEITKDGVKYYLTAKELKDGSKPATGDVVEGTTTVTYVYEKAGSVVVHYTDQEGNPISGTDPEGNNVPETNNDTTDGRPGSDYNTADNGMKPNRIKTAEGKVYELVPASTIGNETGKVVAGDTIEVTYVYKEVKGNVVVKYEDTEGNVIAEDEKDETDASLNVKYDTADHKKDEITKDGVKYYLTAKELKDDSKPATGDVVEGTTTVTYVYEKAGQVVVNYQTEDGTPIVGVDAAGANVASGAKDTVDGRPGSDYDTSDNGMKPNRITTAEGKVYELVPTATKGDETGKVVAGETKEVTYVYKEVTGDVVVHYVDTEGNTIAADKDDLKGASLSEKYDTAVDNKPEKITTEDGTVYYITKAGLKDDSKPETGNVVEGKTDVTYVYEKAGSVIVNYQTEDGTPLVGTADGKDIASGAKDTDNGKPGSEYNTADNGMKPNRITTAEGKVYELVPASTKGEETGTVESGQTKEVTYVYKEVKGNVVVKYEDTEGNPLAEDEKDETDASLNVKYDTADHKKDEITKDGVKYYLTAKELKDDSKPATGDVVEGTTTVTYVYEKAGQVVVNYQTEDGTPLVGVDPAGANVASGAKDTVDGKPGSDYDTSDNGMKPTRITTAEGKVYELVPTATKGDETGKVVAGETKEVTYVYKEVTGDVVVHYVDTEGNVIAEDKEDTKGASLNAKYDTTDNKPEKIEKDGTVYYLTEKALKDDSKPENGDVVEGKTEVTYVYEKAGQVVVHYTDEKGNTIQVDAVDTKDGKPNSDYDTSDNGMKPNRITTPEGKVYELIPQSTKGDETGKVKAGETTEVTYVYKEITGNVVVHYVDTEGNTLAEDTKDVENGSLSEKYDTTDNKPAKLEKDGVVYYLTAKELKEDSKPENGAVVEGTTEITYVYEKAGNVLVHYVDEAGNTLQADAVDTKDGKPGAKYDTSDNDMKPTRITTPEGKVYELVPESTKGNETGDVEAGKTTEVTYVYKEVKGNVVVHYTDEAGNTIAEDVKDTTDGSVSSAYDTTDNKPATITTKDGKLYVLVPTSTKGEESGKVTEGTTEVTYVYKDIKEEASKEIDKALSEKESKIKENPELTNEEKEKAIEEAKKSAEQAKKALEEAKTPEDVEKSTTKGKEDVEKTPVTPEDKPKAKEEIDKALENKVKKIDEDPSLTPEQKEKAKEEAKKDAEEAKKTIDKAPSKEEVEKAKENGKKEVEKDTPTPDQPSTPSNPSTDNPTNPSEGDKDKPYTPSPEDKAKAKETVEKELEEKIKNIDKDPNLTPEQKEKAKEEARKEAEKVKKSIEEGKTTEWIDEKGNPIKPVTPGTYPAGSIPNYELVGTVTNPATGKVTHIFKPVTKEEKTTVWVDVNGKPLKPAKPGTEEAGNVPNYKLVGTTVDPTTGNVIHVFTPTPVVNKVTEWVDTEGNVLKPKEEGVKDPGKVPSYKLVGTVTNPETGKVTHIFRPTTSDKPSTVWVDVNGKPLKPTAPGKEEAGSVPKYKLVETKINPETGDVIHVFTPAPVVNKVTEWVDTEGNVIRPKEEGSKDPGKVPNYELVGTVKDPETGKVTHIFKPSTKKQVTVWVDINGKPLKPLAEGSNPAGEVPGYELVGTKVDPATGNLLHVFKPKGSATPGTKPGMPGQNPGTPGTPANPEKPMDPNAPANPTTPANPAAPATPMMPSAPVNGEAPQAPAAPSEAKGQAELPNTGTADNASLAALGLLGVLSGFGLVARKKKED